MDTKTYLENGIEAWQVIANYERDLEKFKADHHKLINSDPDYILNISFNDFCKKQQISDYIYKKTSAINKLKKEYNESGAPYELKRVKVNVISNIVRLLEIELGQLWEKKISNPESISTNKQIQDRMTKKMNQITTELSPILEEFYHSTETPENFKSDMEEAMPRVPEDFSINRLIEYVSEIKLRNLVYDPKSISVLKMKYGINPDNIDPYLIKKSE
ncbi:hypothetical protein [Facklamia hominis]|uniref:Uncharacterized protein n=1 Tax=Facklamia hominis TaxID=178214 RepID=A0AAJ1Q5Z5_9LACT|nr:hypothetical protein [Facklamia hominis]MDK7187502.1 hypothetical protein [Facklamia hominis]